MRNEARKKNIIIKSERLYAAQEIKILFLILHLHAISKRLGS